PRAGVAERVAVGRDERHRIVAPRVAATPRSLVAQPDAEARAEVVDELRVQALVDELVLGYRGGAGREACRLELAAHELARPGQAAAVRAAAAVGPADDEVGAVDARVGVRAARVRPEQGTRAQRDVDAVPGPPGLLEPQQPDEVAEAVDPAVAEGPAADRPLRVQLLAAEEARHRLAARVLDTGVQRRGPGQGRAPADPRTRRAHAVRPEHTR